MQTGHRIGKYPEHRQCDRELGVCYSQSISFDPCETLTCCLTKQVAASPEKAFNNAFQISAKL